MSGFANFTEDLDTMDLLWGRGAQFFRAKVSGDPMTNNSERARGTARFIVPPHMAVRMLPRSPRECILNAL